MPALRPRTRSASASQDQRYRSTADSSTEIHIERAGLIRFGFEGQVDCLGRTGRHRLPQRACALPLSAAP